MSTAMSPREAADLIERVPMGELSKHSDALMTLVRHVRSTLPGTSPQDEDEAADDIPRVWWSRIRATDHGSRTDGLLIQRDDGRVYGHRPVGWRLQDYGLPADAVRLASLSPATAATPEVDGGEPTLPWALQRIADLSDQVNRLAKPEVMLGEKAEQLPSGSIVVVTGRDDEPSYWHRPIVIGHAGHEVAPKAKVRVLYRAPEPPKSLAVGDMVKTEAQLDVLPVGAVVRGRVVMQREWNGWEMVGVTGRMARPAAQLPARVLHLPETGGQQ